MLKPLSKRLMGNFKLEGSGCHHMNPLIHLSSTKSGTTRVYVLPGKMKLRIISHTYEVVLGNTTATTPPPNTHTHKNLDQNPTKSLDLTPNFKKIKRREE